MALLIQSAVSLNLLSIPKLTVTGIAPVNIVQYLYASKFGSGIKTSSPGPTSILNAMSIASLAPAVTII
ncbi:MAG: hypothetical protein BWY74_02540 [Firmicutes bacterium ADurb.Bin419]|nr:MAG: hypothetical protein BWY74_02540 [Firmicutes bacterium ADurb.Bin419]